MLVSKIVWGGITMKRNAAFLIAVLVLVLSTGCTGDGDKAASGGGDGTLRVRVIADIDRVVPNATVVLGDSTGSMIAYGTTNASGEYTFTGAPANATITTAFSCLKSGTTQTTHTLNIVYDLNVSKFTTWADDCKETKLGTMTVNITNSITGAKNWDIATGSYHHWMSSSGTSLPLSVYESNLQSDGKLSIAVIANDESYTPLGYGFLLDQTFVDGRTFDITVNQPFSYVQYSLSNIPSTVKSVGSQLTMMRKEQDIYLGNWNLLTTATATTVNAPYIPGFADTYDYFAGVESIRTATAVRMPRCIWERLAFPGVCRQIRISTSVACRQFRRISS